MVKDDKLFFGLDGDSIGRRIVAYFIKNEVSELKEFSNSIEVGLNTIRKVAEEKGAEIIYCSGDSILIHGSLKPSFGDEMISIFYEATGRNSSVGIGESLMMAYLGLTLSKARGGNLAVYHKDS